jgi:hypothetical protein
LEQGCEIMDFIFPGNRQVSGIENYFFLWSYSLYKLNWGFMGEGSKVDFSAFYLRLNMSLNLFRDLKLFLNKILSSVILNNHESIQTIYNVMSIKT